MSTHLHGKGLPPPAKFKNIIRDLFQNEKLRGTDSHQTITFSRAQLSSNNLKYPSGFTPLGFFILYQIDSYNTQRLTSSELQLVSFGRFNQDPYIYGSYFSISGVDRYRIPDLETNPTPINLPSSAIITPTNYLEVYNNINGTSVILSLSTNPSAGLQYSHLNKYYYQQLSQNGIIDIQVPSTHLTGLSLNLKSI